MQNEETIKQGKVGLSLYLQYFLAGGGIFFTLLMFIVCILTQVTLFIFPNFRFPFSASGVGIRV